ncbi:MAG TPA: ice-binding family protein, partial [Paludibacter sp.]
MKRKLLGTLLLFVLFLIPNASFGQAPNLGVTSSFALFTAVGSLDNTGATMVTGNVGTNVGAFTGFPDPGTIIGVTHVVDPVSVQAAIDVDVAYSYLFAKTCGPVLGTTLGNNQVLKPNVYCIGGASTLNGDLILDAEGNQEAIFIFKIDGALSTSTFANVILINSASMCNVYWQINGKFELAENSVFRGTVIANGDISLLEGASLFGRGLSREGAISLHNNVVNAAMQPTASTITAGGPTSICGGGNVVLSGNVNGVWSNGATTASITVTASGDYYVRNTNACGIVTSNHISVSISPAVVASVITANKATTFCEGGIVILSGNVGGTWSNGATTASTTITTSGDYYVTNTNACGTVISNHIVVTVNPKPTASTITAGSAITFCDGGSVILSGNNGGTWSNGATTATTTITTAGNYYVTNTNACGSVTSNHIVVTVNAPVVASVITAGGATTFCAGGSVILSGNVGGKWSNNATTATITVTTSGDYSVTNTNACGTVTSNH